MRFLLLLLLTVSSFFSIHGAYADYVLPADSDVKQNNVSVDGDDSGDWGSAFDRFSSFFFDASDLGANGNLIDNAATGGIFLSIAIGIKNLFITLAVVFLFVGILKLFFSDMSDESRKTWRKSLVWVTVGLIIMELAITVWGVMFTSDLMTSPGKAAASIYLRVINVLVQILQLFAGFAFISMMVYAFYMIVTSGGDEEALKKGKRTVIYAVLGFILLKTPYFIIRYTFGKLDDTCYDTLALGSCQVRVNTGLDGSGIIAVFGKIFDFVNGFLFLFCVLSVLYAGWLIFTSAGEEEKVKKAKRIMLYAFIGVLILVASLAIFQFFIMGGNFKNPT